MRCSISNLFRFVNAESEAKDMLTCAKRRHHIQKIGLKEYMFVCYNAKQRVTKNGRRFTSLGWEVVTMTYELYGAIIATLTLVVTVIALVREK